MKKYKWSGIVISVSLFSSIALFCYGQMPHDLHSNSTNELYKKLNSITDEISAKLYGSGSTNTATVGALKQQCHQLFDESGLTDDEKTKFLLHNIKHELSGIEKREVLLKAMLRQLSREKKVKSVDVQFFAPYLSHVHDTFNMQDSILICLLSIGHSDGMPIFTNAPDFWKPVLETNLSPRYTGRGLLCDSLLILAQDEHWNTYGHDEHNNSYYTFSYLTPKENAEISSALISEQKYILARRFLEDKFP